MQACDYTSGATRLKRFRPLLTRKKYASKFSRKAGLAGHLSRKEFHSQNVVETCRALVGVKPSRQIQLGRAPDRYECCQSLGVGKSVSTIQ